MDRRLSSFIDELNREKRRRRYAATEAEAVLYRATRAVKSLRDETAPSRGFGHRLADSVGAPLSRVRLQAGLVHAAALTVAAGLVVISALAGLAWHTSHELREFVGNMKAAVADPTAFGVTSYSGAYQRSSPGAGVDMQFSVSVPGRWVYKESTGAARGTNGLVFWTFSPATGRGWLDQGPRESRPVDDEVVGYAPGAVRLLAAVLAGPGYKNTGPGTFISIGALRLGGTEMVAGRRARVLKVVSADGDGSESGQWYWVDEENYMILKTAMQFNGELFEGSTLISLELNPPVDSSIFEPEFPEGTPVTIVKHGSLTELAAEVGIEVSQPSGVPAGLEPESAILSHFPVSEGDTLAASWEVRWSYVKDEIPWEWGRLDFRVSDGPLQGLEAGLGAEVEILPGLTGLYVSPAPEEMRYRNGVAGYSSLAWSYDGLDYEIEGYNLSLTLGDYFSLARSLVAGQ